MKYLKLFESFYDLEITEDYILEFIEDGDCEISFKNEWIFLYKFSRNWERAAAKLRRMSDRGDHYVIELLGNKWIVIFNPELREFLDSKLLDCEIRPSKDNKDILVWRKDDEVVANQDLKSGWFYVKWWGIWSVFSEKYSMEGLVIQGFIAGWLEERYKLGSVTPPSVWPQASTKLEERYKLGSVTPLPLKLEAMHQLEERYKLGSVTPRWWMEVPHPCLLHLPVSAGLA